MRSTRPCSIRSRLSSFRTTSSAERNSALLEPPDLRRRSNFFKWEWRHLKKKPRRKNRKARADILPSFGPRLTAGDMLMIPAGVGRERCQPPGTELFQKTQSLELTT